MNVGELRELIKDLPDDAYVNIKIGKYIMGSLSSGVISHDSDEYDIQDVEGYEIKNNELFLKCTSIEHVY